MALSPDLKALADFYPIFASDGFSCGEWIEFPAKDEIHQPPYFNYSRPVRKFVKAAYANGWILERFNWVQWMGSEEAETLLSNTSGLDRAGPDQLFKLLTAYIRGDRFSEGALAVAFQSGTVVRIVKRASDIVAGRRHEIS